MPKTGLSVTEWKQRLLAFASGSFVFGRGQSPAPSTRWAREISNIENCPRHVGADRDLFGNPLQCVCGYHKDKSVSSQRKTSTAPCTTSSVQTSQQSGTNLPLPSPAESCLTETKTDYLSRLPAGWEQNMSEPDILWIGKAIFIGKGRLKDTLQFWWHPPAVTSESAAPDVKNYFLHRLFLWMPRKMLGVDFRCPACPKKPDNSLRSKGLYNRVRLVLDVREYYYLAAEYMYCKHCSATYIAYDSRLLGQLSDSVKAKFNVLLTRKYACDRTIVNLLRARTIGNSPTAMRNNIQEIHTDEYLKKQLVYLSDCDRHCRGLQGMHLTLPHIAEGPNMRPVAQPKWFLACYVRDVMDRIDSLKAVITSTYGSILKIDSTKKICKKLQGKAVKSAQWTTNVGNESGEILISILTTSEALSSLQKMADGLMERFKTGNQEPPKLLYTDRDCCNQDQASKLKVLFSKWRLIEIRLDIWHFMRRLAIGCTSESHPLYGTFMSRLSSCIFEWDKDDVNRLKAAKKSELVMSGIPQPSDSAVMKAITKEELERHCRRRTKGAEKTTEGIESLILALTGVTGTLGVPVLKDEITEIWREQKKHVTCIQDVPGIQLYRITCEMKKGTDTLPVFRCARGSTSLESFHSHLTKFIPGTSANAVNFQAYLLDGISRWNQLRCAAALSNEGDYFRTFDLRLKEKVNTLSEKLLNKPLVPVTLLPSRYTGELIGIEYLYDQSGFVLPEDVDLEKEIDEGFEDFEEETSPEIVGSLVEEGLPAGPVYSSDSDTEVEEMSHDEESVCVDSRGIPGWDRVDALAQALVNLTGISVTAAQAKHVKQLYSGLQDFDKMPIRYTARVRKPTTSRFARSKGSHVSVEAVKRCFLSAGSPASMPSKSRVVEAICLHLCDRISSPQKEGGYISRWKVILSEYNKVRQRLLNSEKLLEGTDLILFNINETTLTTWYKDHTRRDEVKLLLQGVALPPHRQIALQPLSEPRAPVSSPVPPVNPLQFPEEEDTTGQAVRRQQPKGIGGEPGSQPTVSRTTLWRKRKAQKEDTGRKVYCCGVCGSPMASEGHTQFRGQRYCPNAADQIPKDQWLLQRKEEAAKKKATQKSAK